MASREARKDKLDAMSYDELDRFVDLANQCIFLDFLKIGGGGPEAERRATIRVMLDEADVKPWVGKLLDQLLGLVTDDERQLRSSERSAQGAKRSARASFVAAIAAVLAVVLGASRPWWCEQIAEEPSATTVRATSHPTSQLAE